MRNADFVNIYTREYSKGELDGIYDLLDYVSHLDSRKVNIKKVLRYDIDSFYLVKKTKRTKKELLIRRCVLGVTTLRRELKEYDECNFITRLLRHKYKRNRLNTIKVLRMMLNHYYSESEYASKIIPLGIINRGRLCW